MVSRILKFMETERSMVAAKSGGRREREVSV
jgi:hypothetical protein